MTTGTVRHPGEDNPEFRSRNACPYCDSLTASCVSPGCVRWEIAEDTTFKRREDM